MTSIKTLATKPQLEAYIKEVEKRLVQYKHVRAWLENNWEGKTINKRLETALRKAFPELKINLSSPYTWWELRICGDGVGYKNELRANMGYTDSMGSALNVARIGFSIKEFDRLTQCYALDEGRIQEYKALLANYDKIAERYLKAAEEFQAADKALGIIGANLTD